MALRSRMYNITLTLATGTSAQVEFPLKAGSHLIHVVCQIGPAGPPLRVAAYLIQPRARATIFNTLVGGWIRGMGVTPSPSHDLTWDGDIQIDADTSLRFQVRNDSGATHGPGISFVVLQ